MEDSASFVRKALSSMSDSDEESGWTMYFEDFLSNNNEKEQRSYSSSVPGSSSFVSDAASSSAKKFDQGKGFSMNKSGKNLRFRNKAKGTLADDALEDTASSPVHSPKVKVCVFLFSLICSFQ